jgi:hypothetical protein
LFSETELLKSFFNCLKKLEKRIKKAPAKNRHRGQSEVAILLNIVFSPAKENLFADNTFLANCYK